MATTLTEANQEYVPRAWEDVACMFCGSRRNRLLEKFGPQSRYRYVRCDDCGLAYLNPRPRYDKEFVETAYGVYESTVEKLWRDGRLTDEGRRQYDWYARLLAEMASVTGRKGRLLEIGCHLGFFLKVAGEHGWQATGVDISPTMTRLGRETFGVNAVCGNWLEMDLMQGIDGGLYDFIYCSHTIEHVPNPADWVDRFAKLLAPGGTLCLEVPNMQSLDRRFKRALKRVGLRKDRWQGWRTPDHLFEPCERSFAPFLRSKGWKIIGLTTYSRKTFKTGPVQRLMHKTLRIGSNLRFYLRR